MDLKQYVEDLAIKTQKASKGLAKLCAQDKNKILQHIALEIKNQQEALKAENAKDMEAGKKGNLSAALLDRLLLNDSRILGMLESLETVIKLDDPVGEIFDSKKLLNGAFVGKKRIPLGTIAMIYESRPNVAVEAASLCIKSGNGVILRGGKEATYSNAFLGKLIQTGIQKAGFSPDMVSMIEVADRETVLHLVKAKGLIDVVIPRGGEGLINFVSEHALIPVIKHDKGVCSLFIDENAQKDMAQAIAINAKVQRPGVCNAIENLFIHKNYPYAKELVLALIEKQVEIRGDQKIALLDNKIKPLKDLKELAEEYLDLILSVKYVEDIDEAIALIATYGSGHSDAIVTENYTHAQQFLNEVSSAAVYVNASTRFTDGAEFGMGAEIGISTNKLHARGPMGLKELCTYQFVVYGSGQIRS